MTDAWFWQLLLAGEVSNRKSQRLIEETQGDPQRLLVHDALTDAERRRMKATSPEALQSVLSAGARVLAQDSLPELLQEAHEAASAVFVHGEAAALSQPCVAIVGTRNATVYGRACARKFAEGLGRAGVTVVSGGALGIDAAAHEGALVGGKTVAVLAGGVDHVYPAVHGGLFARIRESGALVSQFACGAKPGEHKFLLRNDLIAALCQAVLVIEAPPRSGALRTSATAADLGREVFVVPATIDNRAYWGSFNLIRDGATLAYHPDQILESLGIDPIPVEPPKVAMGDAETILSVLTVDPIEVEKIVERTGLDPSTVLSELTMLEIEGRILRGGGGYAVKP